MKKLIVFGAAGRTGKYVVQYALDRGYQVTAFDHTHTTGIHHENLKELKGDVHDEKLVDELIKGQDVVISVLGVKDINSDAVNLMRDAMKIFVRSMEKHGVRRVLAMGGLAVLQLNEQIQMIEKPDYPKEYKNVGEGHNKVYKVLSETNLDWTFVCCPDVIDGPRTGKYRVRKDYPAEGLFQIYTGDVADFLLNEAEENKFLKSRVGICNYE